ncbi:MAG: phosphatase PAP2-related protein [Holophaga sp.]|nr:phosphatase PAP2-related protein [Holophaga sp.]
MMHLPQWVFRAALVALALGAWFWTQALIGKRAFPEGRIGDAVLDFTAPLNRFLLANPAWADRLLILTSALIDLLGIFVVGLAIFGPSLRPLLGLLILFSLRQLCQGLCALPPPEGMIWRNPGFPSLLVTYGTASDLFFSGHTAIAVYGCLELANIGGPIAIAVGVAIALIEVSTVLILRAHYTMDVFTGAVTALWVWGVASYLAPKLDPLLAALGK